MPMIHHHFFGVVSSWALAVFALWPVQRNHHVERHRSACINLVADFHVSIFVFVVVVLYSFVPPLEGRGLPEPKGTAEGRRLQSLDEATCLFCMQIATIVGIME